MPFVIRNGVVQLLFEAIWWGCILHGVIVEASSLCDTLGALWILWPRGTILIIIELVSKTWKGWYERDNMRESHQHLSTDICKSYIIT